MESENVHKLHEPESKADRFRRLFNQAFREPKIGDFWSYQQLKQVFNAPHDDIVEQMRNSIGPMLLRRRLRTECVPREGYRVNDASQNLNLTQKKQLTIERINKKNAQTLSVTDRRELNETEKQGFDKLQQSTAMIGGMLRLEKSLPKAEAPKALEERKG